MTSTRDSSSAPRRAFADLDRRGAISAPTIAGVAGGVGVTTVARALRGLDRGVFTGRADDVLVCRGTDDSLVCRATSAACLITDDQEWSSTRSRRAGTPGRIRRCVPSPAPRKGLLPAEERVTAR